MLSLVAILLVNTGPASSDPLFAQQANLGQIHIGAAWAETHGDASQRIGVVDTGLERDHEEMKDADVDGYDFITDPTVAGDGDGRDANYSDDSAVPGGLAHGSHVAGIIAAPGDNGKGIAGINWRAKIVSARAVSATQGGISTDIMDGAKWLAGLHVDGVPDISQKVDVINMSLGFAGPCDPTTQGIVNDILAAGVPIVAAAGNHGAGFPGTDDGVESPANCTGVISVGAVDGSGALTAYTNANGRIDVVAPGGTEALGIMSLGAGPSVYQSQQGTSMATPHVTGVVSLLLASDPTLTPDDIRSILTGLPSTCTGCNSAPTLDAAEAFALLKGGNGTKVTSSGGCNVASGSPCVLLAFLFLAARTRLRRST